jgi:hypothetical protein
LVRGKKLEALIAEMKRSYDLSARLGTRLAHTSGIRVSMRQRGVVAPQNLARAHECSTGAMAMNELHTARFVSEERRQGGYVAFTLNLPASTKHTDQHSRGGLFNADVMSQ